MIKRLEPDAYILVVHFRLPQNETGRRHWRPLPVPFTL
jgi:hypothetical protein